ncbi:MAG: hypothetical protein Ta2B_05690 [Termitinemataceae bacterium]|nr:MAG: hypothetical protein Ta2B_05690 [Termitinemataceae bacterium]
MGAVLLFRIMICLVVSAAITLAVHFCARYYEYKRDLKRKDMATK